MKSGGGSLLGMASVPWDNIYQTFKSPNWGSLQRLPAKQTQEGLRGELASVPHLCKWSALPLTRASDSIGSENMEVSFSLPWRSKRIWKFWMLTNQQGVWNVWGKFMWLRNVIERDYVHPLPWKDVSFIHIFQASCLYSYYFHREGFYHFFKVTIQK